jgi:hypothetical protein
MFIFKKLLMVLGMLNLGISRVIADTQTGPITGGPTALTNPLGSTSIVQIINNILNYLIYISIPILAIMILIGGFQILTARDNPEKITSGKNTIMYAALGFTIILISKGVALVILKILS